MFYNKTSNLNKEYNKGDFLAFIKGIFICYDKLHISTAILKAKQKQKLLFSIRQVYTILHNSRKKKLENINLLTLNILPTFWVKNILQNDTTQYKYIQCILNLDPKTIDILLERTINSL